MNARYLATDILHGVLTRKHYANLSLKQHLDEVRPMDRGLVTQLVYGTLQNQLYVRKRWQAHLKTQPDALTATVLDMAVYQLLFLDKIPAYAVLNEAQDYLRTQHRGSVTGMVNAVLRKISDEGKIDIQSNDRIETIAFNTSLPTWILRMWAKQYGEEIAIACAQSLILPTDTSVRVNTLLTNMDEVLTDPNASPGRLSLDAIRYRGNFLNSEWFTSGKGVLQDEASQEVVNLLDAKPGMRVLDLCSAPGTKTSAIAQKMQNHGEILALDLHPHRVKLIEEGMTKLGVTIVTAKACDSRDCISIFSPETRFDAVLADVPCSGLGVLRRKPDIKARITPEDLDTLQTLQYQLLTSGSVWVKKDGILVYSTCTLNKKENEKQVDRFLFEHPDFILISQRTIFPYEYETDGFYIAKMQRTGDCGKIPTVIL